MDKVATNRPQSVITRLTTGTGPAILHDAVAREDFHQELLRLIASNATIALSTSGKIVPGSTKVPGESTFAQEIGAPPAVPALVGGSAIVSPVPLSAQPGEAAQPPRTDTANIQSAGAQRLQPGESPSAGDQFPEGDRLDARASIAFPRSWQRNACPHASCRPNSQIRRSCMATVLF